MRVLKLGLMIFLTAIFIYGCGGSASENTTPPPAATPATSDAKSASTPAPTPAMAEATPMTGGNADIGKKPEEKKEEMAADMKAAAKPVSNIDAAALYKAQKCAGCHQTDGKGNKNMGEMPDFTDAAWQKKESDSHLANAIRKGKKPMPAYEGKITDDEIKALVGYVRSFAKK